MNKEGTVKERTITGGDLKRWGIIAGVILVLVLVIAIFAWKTGQRDGESKGEDNAQKLQQELEEWKAKYKELEEHPVMVEPITPEISMSEIQQEIRQLGELATVEYFYTNAARFSDGKTLWGIRLSEKSFVLKWDGTIKAGIDVDGIGIEPQEESRVLTVKLPAARILSHDPDLDSVEVVDQKNGLFDPVTVEDQTKFNAECEKAMEKKALERGLLEQAQENAKEILRQLLQKLPGIREGGWKIEFQTAEG